MALSGHEGGERMVLIAGGTGRLGTRVVELLTTRRMPIRVLTRDRARAAHVREAVEVVEGDWAGHTVSVRPAGGSTFFPAVTTHFSGEWITT